MAEEQRQSKNKSGPAPAAKPQGRPGFGAPSAAHAGAEKYGPDFRHIVSVVNTDLKGEKKVRMALQKIKGLSHMFSNFVCHSAKVDPLKITGKLNQDEVTRLEDVIRNPAKYNCPSWMMNRRKDSETGNDIHIITTDLDLTIDNDIKKMKKIRSYKGVRHMLGQPVRGQRTKSNFRKNKGKVSLGVGGKKAAPKKA